MYIHNKKSLITPENNEIVETNQHKYKSIKLTNILIDLLHFEIKCIKTSMKFAHSFYLTPEKPLVFYFLLAIF